MDGEEGPKLTVNFPETLRTPPRPTLVSALRPVKDCNVPPPEVPTMEMSG